MKLRSSLIQTLLSVLEFHQISRLRGSRTIPPVGNSADAVTQPRRNFLFICEIISHINEGFNGVADFSALVLSSNILLLKNISLTSHQALFFIKCNPISDYFSKSASLKFSGILFFFYLRKSGSALLFHFILICCNLRFNYCSSSVPDRKSTRLNSSHRL